MYHRESVWSCVHTRRRLCTRSPVAIGSHLRHVKLRSASHHEGHTSPVHRMVESAALCYKCRHETLSEDCIQLQRRLYRITYKQLGVDR